jgi:hypothetical protein
LFSLPKKNENWRFAFSLTPYDIYWPRIYLIRSLAHCVTYNIRLYLNNILKVFGHRELSSRIAIEYTKYVLTVRIIAGDCRLHISVLSLPGTRLTRRGPLVEQELLTLPEHLSSLPVLCVCFVDRCLSFRTFSFAIVLSVLIWYTDSDCPLIELTGPMGL